MCLRPIRLKPRLSPEKLAAISYDSAFGSVEESVVSNIDIVPCGKCPECLSRRANDWIMRMMCEEKIHKSSHFLTLTYAPENMVNSVTRGRNGKRTPIRRVTRKKFMTVNKVDWQLFMKKLRLRSGCDTLKYYMCAEYGTDTFRPHYHAILFDANLRDVEACWTHGTVHAPKRGINSSMVAYVTKYMCKSKRIPMHANDDRLPEFSLMSKGMGANYLTDEMILWHWDNKASYYVDQSGFKHPLPRYYRDRIFNPFERAELAQISLAVHRDQLQKALDNAGSVDEYYRLRLDASLLKQSLFDNKIMSKRKTI